MQLLNRLFRLVAKRKEFIVRGSTQFNYTYQPIGGKLIELASRISSSTPPLESSFAILTFPLAYSKNVMANCNLVHELGHLIVDSKDLITRLDSILTPDQTNRVSEIIESHTRTSSQLDFQITFRRDKIKKVFQNWIHETMADYIGTLLVGPCILLAFMELIESKGAYQRDDDEHPCDSSRIAMIIERLRTLGWDSVIRQESPDVWERAERIAGSGRTVEPLYDAAAQCMPLVKDDAYKLVYKICRTLVYKPATFLAVKDNLYGLLERGIPPAEQTIVGSEVKSIDSVSIINGGWFFYEKGYPEWDKRFSSLSLEDKTDFLNRLLAKAIEITFVKEAWNR